MLLNLLIQKNTDKPDFFRRITGKRRHHDVEERSMGPSGMMFLLIFQKPPLEFPPLLHGQFPGEAFVFIRRL